MNLSPEILQAVHDATYYVAFNLTSAILAFMQRDSFLYWPFIISTIAVAALAAGITARAGAGTGSWRGVFRDYFRAGVWWHRSARADYWLYFANALVLPLLFGWFLFSDTRIVALIDAALGRPAAAPDVQGAEAAGVIARILFTVFFFIAYDFGRFLAHCLLHDVPVLWEFHKVHHSAEVLTPITAYRAHPVDLLVMAWLPAVTTGIVTWIFNQVGAGAVTFYSFLGLHVVIWAFNLVDNLRHSHVWLSYGPGWGLWLVSPAHHQLHHSCEPRHFGRNRGFTLAVWDRLYGTLYVPGARPEEFRMGLGDGTDGRWHGLWRMYVWPLAGFGREMLQALRRRQVQR